MVERKRRDDLDALMHQLKNESRQQLFIIKKGQKTSFFLKKNNCLKKKIANLMVRQILNKDGDVPIIGCQIKVLYRIRVHVIKY